MNLITSWNDGTTFDPHNLKCCPGFMTAEPHNCSLESQNYFFCEYNDVMIPSSFVCNNYPNCGDGSDEENCQYDWFACEDGKSWVPPEAVCDGVSACGDGSDEREAACGDLSSTLDLTSDCQCYTYNNLSLLLIIPCP